MSEACGHSIVLHVLFHAHIFFIDLLLVVVILVVKMNGACFYLTANKRFIFKIMHSTDTYCQTWLLSLLYAWEIFTVLPHCLRCRAL